MAGGVEVDPSVNEGSQAIDPWVMQSILEYYLILFELLQHVVVIRESKLMYAAVLS